MALLASWVFLLGIRILAKEISYNILTKRETDKGGQADRIVCQQSMQFTIAVTLLIVMGDDLPPLTVPLFAAWFVGILDGPATFARWAGFSVAMTPFAFLSRFADVFIFILAFAVLGEAKFMNAGLSAGVAICILAGVLYTWQMQVVARKEGKKAKASFLRYLSWTMISGGAAAITWLCQRLFASKEMLTGEQFLAAYYLGALMSSFILRKWPSKTVKAQRAELSWRARANLIPLAICNFTGVYALWYVYAQAPLMVVNPILMIARIACPAIIGIWMFKERTMLTKMRGWSYIFITLSIIGTCLLAYFH